MNSFKINNLRLTSTKNSSMLLSGSTGAINYAFDKKSDETRTFIRLPLAFASFEIRALRPSTMLANQINDAVPHSSIAAIKRAHVVSLSVKRDVKSDLALGIIYADVVAAAKQLSPLLKNLQGAMIASNFPAPDGCQIRILEAEKSDATDFRVAVLLESAELTDEELATAAQDLFGSLKKVFECVASPSRDIATLSLFEPLDESQKKLGIELSKIAKTVEFELLEPAKEFGPRIKFAKRPATETNAVVDRFELRGKIVGVPKRTEFHFASVDQRNFKVKATNNRDQTMIALLYAVELPVSIELKKLESVSTRKKTNAQWFQLEKILSADASDVALVSEARKSIRALDDLIGGDVTLDLSPAAAPAKKQTKKKVWGSGPRLTPPA